MGEARVKIYHLQEFYIMMIGPRLPWNVGVGLVECLNSVEHLPVLALFEILRDAYS